MEVAKKRIAEAMTLTEFRKEKTDIELSEEKLISERDALMMKLNVQHDVSAKIDLFKETCHKFLSKINDPKIVTEWLKKGIIKIVIDEVVIKGESVKIFATISLPNKIHEWEMYKTDIPGTFNAGATLGLVNETDMARIWNHSTKLMTGKHKQPLDPARGKSDASLKRKVFVALSGGVDSAVSAALLKKQGHGVVGVYMKPWQPEGIRCLWEQDRSDAMRVAAHLDIPFQTWDFSDAYGEQVAAPLVQGYEAGVTPNPDVDCNRHIKFGLFLERALTEGADAVATGHHARIVRHQGLPWIATGRDAGKDQSYFLWGIRPACMEYVRFPIGHLQKSQVRRIAQERGLPVADKRDSQGVCFVGPLPFKTFLKGRIASQQGQIQTTDGTVIGTHDGAAFYTIGQRHGFALTRGDGPYYVVCKDIARNVLMVGREEDLQCMQARVTDINWFGGRPALGVRVCVKIRYRSKAIPAILTKGGGISFFRPVRAVSPGQSAVFYRGERVIGGGILC